MTSSCATASSPWIKRLKKSIDRPHSRSTCVASLSTLLPGWLRPCRVNSDETQRMAAINQNRRLGQDMENIRIEPKAVGHLVSIMSSNQ